MTTREEAIKSERRFKWKQPQHLVNELTLQSGGFECPVCLNEIKSERRFNKDHPSDLVITICGHKYCATCFDKITSCAVCRHSLLVSIIPVRSGRSGTLGVLTIGASLGDSYPRRQLRSPLPEPRNTVSPWQGLATLRPGVMDS